MSRRSLSYNPFENHDALLPFKSALDGVTAQILIWVPDGMLKAQTLELKYGLKLHKENYTFLEAVNQVLRTHDNLLHHYPPLWDVALPFPAVLKIKDDLNRFEASRDKMLHERDAYISYFRAVHKEITPLVQKIGIWGWIFQKERKRTLKNVVGPAVESRAKLYDFAQAALQCTLTVSSLNRAVDIYGSDTLPSNDRDMAHMNVGALRPYAHFPAYL